MEDNRRGCLASISILLVWISANDTSQKSLLWADKMQTAITDPASADLRADLPFGSGSPFWEPGAGWMTVFPLLTDLNDGFTFDNIASYLL